MAEVWVQAKDVRDKQGDLPQFYAAIDSRNPKSIACGEGLMEDQADDWFCMFLADDWILIDKEDL